MLRLTEREISTLGLDPTQWYDVTVTETLKQIVRVEARSPEEAEQLVAKDWINRDFILDDENFTCAEFEAVPVKEDEKSAEKTSET